MSEIALIKRLKCEDTRKEAYQELKCTLSNRGSTFNKTKIYNCIYYVASHTYYFTDEEYETVAKMAIASPTFTKKQKDKIDSWIGDRDNLIEKRYDDGCNATYVYYDGPDDPDRYLGHGEFDDDDGYTLWQ